MKAAIIDTEVPERKVVALIHRSSGQMWLPSADAADVVWFRSDGRVERNKTGQPSLAEKFDEHIYYRVYEGDKIEVQF